MHEGPSYSIAVAAGVNQPPVGYSCLVDQDAVVTCAHVVNLALGLPKNNTERPGNEALLLLSVRVGGRQFARTARVEAWVPPPASPSASAGDVCGLRVTEPFPSYMQPVGLSGEPPHLGALGYVMGRTQSRPSGTWIAVELRGNVDNGDIQVQAAPGEVPLELGFSGSPVYDADHQLVGLVQYVGTEQHARDALLLPRPVLAHAWPEMLGHLDRPKCPYPGLLAYSDEDSELFFGRTADTARILEAIASRKCAIVFGASGVGKSSVVRAGALPRLAPRHLVTLRPGAHPWASLARAILAAIDPASTAPPSEVDALATRLTTNCPATIGELFVGSEPPVIFVDQTEELNVCDREVSSSFVRALFAGGVCGHFGLIFAVRDDSLGVLTGIPDYPQSGCALLPITPMGVDDLRLAIDQPAATMGVRYEAGLVQRLARDATGTTLPLLQFMLTQLWPMQRGSLISFAAYDSLGAIEGVIDRFAERQVQRSGDSAEEVDGALSMLVGATREGAFRRRVSRDSCGPSAWAILESLAAVRIVVLGTIQGVVTAELAHEALISAWPRLARLVERDREFMMWRDRARERSLAHDFLSGVALGEAQDWAVRRGSELDEDLLAFIAQCAHRQEEEDRDARARQHELFAAEETDALKRLELATAALTLRPSARSEALVRAALADVGAEGLAREVPPSAETRAFTIRDWSSLEAGEVLLGGHAKGLVVRSDGSVAIRNGLGEIGLAPAGSSPVLAAVDADGFCALIGDRLLVGDLTKATVATVMEGLVDACAVAVRGELAFAACANGRRVLATLGEAQALEEWTARPGLILEAAVTPGRQWRVATLASDGALEFTSEAEPGGREVGRSATHMVASADQPAVVEFDAAGDTLFAGKLGVPVSIESLARYAAAVVQAAHER